MIDEASKGRNEARCAVPCVPRGMQWILGIELYDCVVCFLKFEKESRDEDCSNSADGFCVSERLQDFMVSGIVCTHTGQ